MSLLVQQLLNDMNDDFRLCEIERLQLHEHIWNSKDGNDYLLVAELLSDTVAGVALSIAEGHRRNPMDMSSYLENISVLGEPSLVEFLSNKSLDYPGFRHYLASIELLRIACIIHLGNKTKTK